MVFGSGKKAVSPDLKTIYESGAKNYHEAKSCSGENSQNFHKAPNWVFYSDQVLSEDAPSQELKDSEYLGGALLALVVGLAALLFSAYEGFQSHQYERDKKQVEAKGGTIVGYTKKGNYPSFVDTYDRNGGISILGNPTGFLEHGSPLLKGASCDREDVCFSKIQRFSGGKEEQGVIIQSINSSEAYWVGGVFFRAFHLALKEDALLEPLSEKESHSGFTKQLFSTKQGTSNCGAIFQIAAQAYYVGDKIGCHYFHKAGGEKGVLGLPTSNPKSDRNGGFVQYFERGCIQQSYGGNTKLINPLEDCLS